MISTSTEKLFAGIGHDGITDGEERAKEFGEMGYGDAQF